MPKEAYMKSNKFTIFIVSVLVLFCLSSFAETKKLEQIGRYTLVRIKGEVPTEEVMKTLLDKYAGDIKYGFDLTGYGDLYLPFMEQLKASSFEEKELAVGDTLMWMLFRSRGKVKVVEDVEWAGKEPLPVFSFTVKKGFKHYEFIMPKPCGNISLRGVEEIIPPAVCDIKVEPGKANINDPISIDMSGTQHAKSMELEIFGPDGAKVAAQTLTPDSPKWQTKFDKPGEYTFKARAINHEDKPSDNPCEAKTYINFPPECNLWTSCSPCKNYVGRPITIDSSNSSDSDGEVVKVDFDIMDEAGNTVDTYTDTNKPFSWEKVFMKEGVYSITAVVTDDFGAASQPCKIDLEVTRKKCFFTVEGGFIAARGSHGPYAAALLGGSCWIVPDVVDFTISGGGAIALKGEPWKSFFLAKALLNVHSGPAFFGAGIGFNTQVKEGRDESDIFLVASLGVDVFNNWISKGALFVEGHGPVGSGRTIADHHRILLGFRFYF
jgi:hypothetical protein